MQTARRHHIPPHHGRCHHDRYSPRAVVLGLTRILIKGKHMNVTGSFTAPTKRKSGADLALTDIDHFSLTRNGVEIQKLAPSGPVISWIDNEAITGTDVYNVFTLTKDGFISDTSNDATVIVVQADPASAISDLTATFNP
jgi:hypothetical protein